MSKATGVLTALILVAGIWCLLGTNSSEGQVVLGGGPVGGDGTIVLAEPGSSVYSLVFRLRDDNTWASARTELVERASSDDRIEVIYALTKIQKSNQEEKVGNRIESVIAALTEADLYPLTRQDLKDQVASLKTTLAKVAKAKPSDEITPAVLMALVRAQKQAEQGLLMAETGEEPEPRRAGRGGGRIIRRTNGG